MKLTKPQQLQQLIHWYLQREIRSRAEFIDDMIRAQFCCADKYYQRWVITTGDRDSNLTLHKYLSRERPLDYLLTSTHTIEEIERILQQAIDRINQLQRSESALLK